MLKAIGFVIVLYSITVMMHDAFSSFEDAVTATFETFEVAAIVSKQQLIESSY